MERPQYSVIDAQREAEEKFTRRAAMGAMPAWWYGPRFAEIVNTNWTVEQQRGLAWPGEDTDDSLV